MSRNGIGVLLVLFVLEAALTGLRGEEPETLTVCEVVQNLESLNGKEVAVRGRLVSTDHEHVLLPAGKCPGERRRHGYVWSNRIHLVDAPYGKRDREAYEAQEKQIMDAFGGESSSLFKVVITFVGTLATKWNDVYRMPDGSYVGGGFGFLNTSPAELSIVTSRDIEVHRIFEKKEPENRP